VWPPYRFSFLAWKSNGHEVVLCNPTLNNLPLGFQEEKNDLVATKSLSEGEKKKLGGHQVVLCKLGWNTGFFSYLSNKKIQMPNPILFFLKIFFSFKRGDPNLIFFKKNKSSFYN
jgi:hypothetical protein